MTLPNKISIVVPFSITNSKSTLLPSDTNLFNSLYKILKSEEDNNFSKFDLFT